MHQPRILRIGPRHLKLAVPAFRERLTPELSKLILHKVGYRRAIPTRKFLCLCDRTSFNGQCKLLLHHTCSVTASTCNCKPNTLKRNLVFVWLTWSSRFRWWCARLAAHLSIFSSGFGCSAGSGGTT